MKLEPTPEEIEQQIKEAVQEIEFYEMKIQSLSKNSAQNKRPIYFALKNISSRTSIIDRLKSDLKNLKNNSN